MGKIGVQGISSQSVLSNFALRRMFRYVRYSMGLSWNYENKLLYTVWGEIPCTGFTLVLLGRVEMFLG